MRGYPNQASLLAKAANGDGALIIVSGMTAVACQVTGTFVAEAHFEASLDGITWAEFYGTNISDANHALEKKLSGPGVILFKDLGGIQFIRAVVENYSSGAVTAIFAGIG